MRIDANGRNYEVRRESPMRLMMPFGTIQYSNRSRILGIPRILEIRSVAFGFREAPAGYPNKSDFYARHLSRELFAREVPSDRRRSRDHSEKEISSASPTATGSGRLVFSGILRATIIGRG